MAFVVQPTSTVAGAGLAPAVQVAVQDGLGNTVTSSTASVTVAIGANPGGGTLSGTASVAAVSGVASFASLSINKSGNGYTLTAASTGLAGATSGGFNITAGRQASWYSPRRRPARSPARHRAPGAGLGGGRPGQRGDLATTSISMAIGTNPPGNGVLSGMNPVSAMSGVATFTTLSIDKAGTGYTLTATGRGLPQATSAAFNISVGTGNKLGFIVQPSSAVTGAGIAPSIQVAVQDNVGNTIPGATDAITLIISNNPGGGALSGTTTVSAVNGVATFPGLSINHVGTGYTLAALASGLSSTTSGSFNITQAGTVTSITSDVPDPSVVGQAVNVAYSVAASAPGSGTPTGTVTVTDGVDMCFAAVAAGTCALSFTTPGARTLTATYAGSADYASSASAGAAHTVNQASTSTTLTAHTPNPSVVGQGIVASYSVVVVAPGGGSLSGNVSVSDGTDSCSAPASTGTCTLVPTTAGAKTLTATYLGDAGHSGSSDTRSHTVNPAATTTAITADTPDPSSVGQMLSGQLHRHAHRSRWR